MALGELDSIDLNGQPSVIESNLVDELDLECDEKRSSPILDNEDRTDSCSG